MLRSPACWLGICVRAATEFRVARHFVDDLIRDEKGNM
jgi:hypothetical protein